MNKFLKKLIKWTPRKNCEKKNISDSVLITAVFSIFEEALLWKSLYLTVSLIISFNVIFFVCLCQQVNFPQFTFVVLCTYMILDAFESWLKFKHRTSFLKSLAEYSKSEYLINCNNNIKLWFKLKLRDLFYLRENNHAKAFLLTNIIFGFFFIIGKYCNGYLLTYLICMFMCVSHKVLPALTNVLKRIQKNSESEGELEGLLPETNDINLKLLSIDNEVNKDEKQSLDYWKPNAVPIDDVSDSSENSSSLDSNFSVEKFKTFDKDIDSTDDTDEDYIPLIQQKLQLQSNPEKETASTWGGFAYNTLFKITSSISSAVYSSPPEKKPLIHESSDGFELIDENDLN